MHFVIQSATTSAAAERKHATARRLTSRCRHLTAELGLNGFTIDEVCQEVGISRRTFFNYFPTKEDAVFGTDEVDALRQSAADFIALGSRGWGVVVDDLLAMAIRHVTSAGLTAGDHAQFMKVLEREPRLLAKFIGLNKEREAELRMLVAQREGVPASDPHAKAAVDVASTVMRSVGDRLTDPHVAENFGATILDTVAALRVVLAPSAGKARS